MNEVTITFWSHEDILNLEWVQSIINTIDTNVKDDEKSIMTKVQASKLYTYMTYGELENFG